MSFSFREKGRLSDRLRGKTCDEILKELRDQLHQDRSMSFDSTPSWGGFSSGPVFSRAGFPFMDQDMMHRPDMRAHFEDLASRHPEFADHLRPAAWGTVPEVDPHFFQSEPYRQRHPSGSSGSGSGVFSEDGAVPIPVIHEDSGGGNGGSSRGRTRKIPQYGLRNTVDLGESQKVNPEDTTDGEARSQRSWSAPPDNRTQGEAPNPKRFVTRVDINDKNNQPTSVGNDPTSPGSSGMNSPGKPPPFPKTSGASSPQSQQQSFKSGNVRHIPIFVEGRDEPVLPKPRDNQSYASAHSSSGFGQPNYSYSYAQAPPGSHSSAFASSHATCSPPGQRKSQTNPPHASKPHPQPSVPPEPKQSIPTKQPQAPPKPINPKDPIAKVQAIQAEVNELKELVEKFSGNRTDKEYIYLDEMLTRNLIKLDDIETDGKENIRQARREAIKSIQKCISILESKAPLPQDMTTETAEGGEASAMEVESKNETSNDAVAEPSANLGEMAKVEQFEKMKVECSGNEGSLESQAEIPVPEDGEISNKPLDSLNVSENNQLPSEQSSEKMEVVTEQPSEKMEVVLDQPAQEIVSQPTDNIPSLAEAGTDQSHTTEVTNTPEIVNAKTELGSNANEQTSDVIADAPVVTEGIKSSNSVETPNVSISSEVDVSSSEIANPQDSHSALDRGVEKGEVVSGENLVTESTQSVVPANESAEKAVSS